MEKNDPSRERSIPLFIVGIGASAGGLITFADFLENLPEDTGMAFVLVSHLPDKPKSMLTELLSTKTDLPMHEAKNGTAVLANTIYVMPSGKNMTIKDGKLLLLPRKKRIDHLPIDEFFQSLAIDQKEKSIGVIFS